MIPKLILVKNHFSDPFEKLTLNYFLPQNNVGDEKILKPGSAEAEE